MSGGTEALIEFLESEHDMKKQTDGVPAQQDAMPAQKAMKQFSKTEAERGEPGPDSGTTPRKKRPVSPGDAAVGESDNQGASPHGDRSLKERPLREK